MNLSSSMRPSQIATLFLGSFAVTILLLERWQEASYPPALWLLIGLLGLLGLLLGLLRQHWRSLAPAAIALTLGATLALGTVQRAVHAPVDVVGLPADGTYRELRGIVVEEPDVRGLSARYVVEITHSPPASDSPARTRILVTDPDGLPPIAYGDEISAAGNLESPEGSYALFLRTKQIGSVMRRARTERLSGGHGSRITGFLLAMKRRFQRQINRIFPEPESALLSGLLLGARALPNALEESFRRSGLLHITAVSGFNITLVLNAVGWVFFFVPSRWRFLPSALAVSAFTILVGASASAVRAAIMGILGLLALNLGRPKEMRLLILWAFFAMTLWNPLLPWYDPGFQLSFLAVIGITEIVPVIRGRLSWITDVLHTRENLAATLAAQLCVLPILAAQFGTLSIVAPIANVLAAPAIPAAMLLGFLGVILSFLSFPLGQLVSLLCFGYLLWIRGAAELAAGIPSAEIAIEGPALWMAVAYYGMLAGGVAWAKGIIRLRRKPLP